MELEADSLSLDWDIVSTARNPLLAILGEDEKVGAGAEFAE